MALSGLPEDGELRVGPVSLPAGQQITAGYELAVPVAWATAEWVPGPGRIWAALSDVQQETGLVPVLLAGLPPGEEDFGYPADVTELGHMDAASVLEGLWDGKTNAPGIASPGEDEERFEEHLRRTRAPFFRQFPGLAPPGETPLSREHLDTVLGSLPPRRIGLVPATRPADVLPLIGWTPSDQSDALPIAAVVRSWEDRFGARLLEVGLAEIRLLVSRPPRSTRHAQQIAAEHVAFCDECAGQGLNDIPRIAASLMDIPIWTFWWD